MYVDCQAQMVVVALATLVVVVPKHCYTHAPRISHLVVIPCYRPVRLEQMVQLGRAMEV